MAVEVPFSTVETIYMPVRSVHPVTQDVDISALALSVALPVDGVAPSSWVASTWETGNVWIDGERYYLAKFALNGSGFALVASTTYRMFARVGTGPVVVKGPTIYAVAT